MARDEILAIASTFSEGSEGGNMCRRPRGASLASSYGGLTMMPQTFLSAEEDSDGCYASNLDSIFGEGTDGEQPNNSANDANCIGLISNDDDLKANQFHNWSRDYSSGCGRPDLEEEHDSEDDACRPHDNMKEIGDIEIQIHPIGAQVDSIDNQEEHGFGKLTGISGLMALSKIRTSESSPSESKRKFQSLDRSNSSEEHDSEDDACCPHDNMKEIGDFEIQIHQIGAQVDSSDNQEEHCVGKLTGNSGFMALSKIRNSESPPSDSKRKFQSLDRSNSLEELDKADSSLPNFHQNFFPLSSNKASSSGRQQKRGESFGIAKEVKGLSLEVPMYVKEEFKARRPSVSSKVSINSEEGLRPEELTRYVEALDVNESYIDTVLDMESVLLEPEGSRERFSSVASILPTSPGRGRFSFVKKILPRIPGRVSEDGSSSASSSWINTMNDGNAFTATDIPVKLDFVEVVGAKQVRGGASFRERMVGVKDHTVYCITVRSNGREWNVERRYRDFVDLYHQLKHMLYAQNVHLPTCWEEVARESRKVFGGNSPDAMEQRSTLIQTCLMSLVQAGSPFNTASPLFWFLNPTGNSDKLYSEALGRQLSLQCLEDSQVDSSELQPLSSDLDGARKDHNNDDKNNLVFGKTIGLVLHVHPKKTVKQLLQAQHYSCAGCYKCLDVANSLMQGLAQNFGWGKPRLCEYSGQLFCTSCHLNETAVLPAQVLQYWDFTSKKVSQLAKAYLDSIYEQPMLCVSAVNPYLYSRVPILAHAIRLRRRLSKMICCIQCPLRVRLQQTLGSRRYVLENNDFFALRDLEDLSKGAFSVLPGLMKDLCEKLTIHILQQCSVCRDVGERCGAGFLCEDPFSPIFPFQDTLVTSCQVCNLTFHRSCFEKCSCCPSCNSRIGQ